MTLFWTHQSNRKSRDIIIQLNTGVIDKCHLESSRVEDEHCSETRPQTHKSKTNLKQKPDEGNKAVHGSAEVSLSSRICWRLIALTLPHLALLFKIMQLLFFLIRNIKTMLFFSRPFGFFHPAAGGSRAHKTSISLLSLWTEMQLHSYRKALVPMWEPLSETLYISVCCVLSLDSCCCKVPKDKQRKKTIFSPPNM